MFDNAHSLECDQKHEIKEPLLRSAIEGGKHGLPHLPEFTLHDHWNSGTGGLAHLFLIFLVRLEFGLHRIPGFGDRMYSDYSLRSSALDFFAELTDEDLINSRQALREVYQHTQSFLLSQTDNKRIHNGKAYLGRGVKHEYALKVKYANDRAISNNEDYISIKTDTLSPYSYGCVGYTDGLRFWRWISFENILMTNKNVKCLYEDEWLIINKDPRGLIDIETNDIKIEPGYEGHRLQIASDCYENKRDFLIDDFEPYYHPISQLRDNAQWVRDGKLVAFAKKVEMVIYKHLSQNK